MTEPTMKEQERAVLRLFFFILALALLATLAQSF